MSRESLVRDAPDGFAEPGWEPDGDASRHGRGGARRIQWGAGGAFFRPLRHGGLLGSLLRDRYVSVGRLRREIDAAIRLRAMGVCVPRPIVGRAERCGTFWKLGLVAEYLEGLPLDAALDVAPYHARRRYLVAAGRAVGRLHVAGFRHTDLHPGNLLVVDKGSGHERGAAVTVAVLDLTNGCFGLRPGSPAAIASLVRCARWWQKHRDAVPSSRDVLAFLRGYVDVVEAPRDARAWRHRLYRRGAVLLRRALLVRGRSSRS
ncbi:MAG: hypothetical protein H6832_07220 [Planctomycetes bacterium]|nr:hypothetical protein [Planctomycetota bacterium]MCB9890360.1 hypothetical protein [Planctomycetota bacterium]MCB9918178.1 hypothetical protein [Planctomycetota bacterium]